MVEIVPFRAEHLAAVGGEENWITPQAAAAVEEGGQAITAMAEGTVVFCGGALEMWPGRALAWARVNEVAARRHATSVTRAVQAFLKAVPARRIEANVACDNLLHHRWVRHLGFVMEKDRMRKFLPDGSDAAMYVIVKEG